MGRTQDTVVCFSHLRWNFVYQRPQHLMSRCAAERDVVFFEEPVFDAARPQLELYRDGGVRVAVPHVVAGTSAADVERALRTMVDRVVERELAGARPIVWYYTPMAVAFTHHVKARGVVYDCMDELSLFHGAPPHLQQREQLLLRAADVVFTGGHSLYEYKRQTCQHRNLYPFPSSVDVPHFARARERLADPPDQADIAYPRIGFAGVIDERMDLALLAQLAELRPDLQLVMIGPVTKIDPAVLPRRPNIHYLGPKRYEELPAYIAGWDVAWLPFARNDATRFISPTKTPEYLAAGKPVVSTSIRDVVRPYGEAGLAWIADSVVETSAAIDEALASDRDARLGHADTFLAHLSWDRTWEAMWECVEDAIAVRAMRVSSATTAAAASSLAKED